MLACRMLFLGRSVHFTAFQHLWHDLHAQTQVPLRAHHSATAHRLCVHGKTARVLSGMLLGWVWARRPHPNTMRP